MTVSQADFRSALLNADQPVPSGLGAPDGSPAGARFSVYRNNVIVSLTEAMSTAFPLVRNLLGSETFARLAAVFVRSHPPSSPLMMFYGERLPDFLEDFQPLRHIPYLADCARLDLAFRTSYHAADATAFDPRMLGPGADETALLSLRLRLAPSSIVLSSHWPVFDIWRFNMVEGATKPQAGAQDVLVTRPEYDPQPVLLPLGTRDWLDLMQQGVPLGEAAEQTLARIPAFDLEKSLTLALQARAFEDIN